MALRERMAEFGAATLSPGAAARDREQRFSHELWRACAGAGIQQLALPERYGGPLPEVNFPRALLAMEGLGYGCAENGLPFALNASMWTVMTPILAFGTAQQKDRYLPASGQGTLIGAHAITEPGAGSDVAALRLRAEPVPGGYRLNGTKHLITLAPVCDYALVFASTRPDLGSWGVSAFLVDRGTPGFAVGDKQDKLGMRSVPLGALTFTDCFVPEGARLGREGLGFSIMNHSLEYDRCSILASQLGAMERQLEQTIDYARTREQGGQRIGKYQSVANRIVDMKLRLETSRLLLYKTAWLKQRGEAALLEAALLKLQLSEAFVASSLDAMRTHGGISYLQENGLDRDLRDAVGGVLYAGTSDIQRNIVAKLLGL